jgi:hypothetical protein
MVEPPAVISRAATVAPDPIPASRPTSYGEVFVHVRVIVDVLSILAAMTPAEPNASAEAETPQLAVIASETLKVVVAVLACVGVWLDRTRVAAIAGTRSDFTGDTLTRELFIRASTLVKIY